MHQAVLTCQAQPIQYPYTPAPESVTIVPHPGPPTTSVSVSVDLPDGCHSVGDWGRPVQIGNAVSVDSQFWWLNMICFPVVNTVSTNYNLGALAPGAYTFSFSAWGTPIGSEAFSVPGSTGSGLTIRRISDSQARISWPSNTAALWVLHSKGGLDAALWTVVTNTPVVTNGEFVVTVSLSGSQEFYTLR